MNLITRLLRRNVSPAQTVGYALANLTGLLIVIVAIQFYRDVTSVGADEDSFVSSDYLIISKQVSGFGGATPFSEEEQKVIAAQEWAAETGAFTSADFNVSLSLDIGRSQMYTSLFLESIPDRFFDISPEGWKSWTPESHQPLPLIISKDYLTLYNFGYASSRGLPQVSEQMIATLPLRLSLSGNGHQEWINARIVGFSSRLNTIAVPEAFMQWANPMFGQPKTPLPSRLIIKLRRAGDPAATRYLADHGYEAAGDREAGGRMAWFLGLATAVVVGIGAIITLLAIFILVLSVWLLLQKNRSKIHDLLLLGYTPKRVSAVYIRLIAVVNAAVLLAAVGILLLITSWWHPALANLGTEGASIGPTLLWGLGITAATTAIGAIAVSRNIRSAFRL
ncbi:MAG: ABC transporter permease [Duncaniella sp.]|nr:ABC transporter permease [Duncaniella sp.]